MLTSHVCVHVLFQKFAIFYFNHEDMTYVTKLKFKNSVNV